MYRLGYYLKRQRSIKVLHQEEAADIIGISRVRYSQMENDKVYSYDPKTLKAVADFLKQDTKWVLEKLPVSKK